MSDEVVRRLVKSQEELASATDRFASGIAQRGEPIPALAEALAAMNLARAALADRKLAVARPHEETALASLVSARRNIRKLLSQSNQQQASACRSFDRQEQQNLRRPPQDEKKRQLASLEKDLRELAKEEREFSEEIEPRSRSGQPTDRPPAPSRSIPCLASSRRSRRQSGCATWPGRMKVSRIALASASAMRPKRFENRPRRSRQGVRLKPPNEARTAAEQLERLARQVGALKASELADQMARTRDLTRELAAEQRALEQALRAGRDRRRMTGTTASGPSASATWPRRLPAWAT